GELDHREHVSPADPPAGHRADRRRDRPAETHVVAPERGALRDRNRPADRDRIAADTGAREERDRASYRHRIVSHVTGARDGAADGHGLVDGLVGADRQGSAEDHALGPVATAPLPPSLAP